MQKTLLLVLMMVISALASRAQVEKNDWLLGGYFNFNTSSSSSNNGSLSNSNSNLSPELGWAAGKNSVIGIRGGLSISTGKDNAGNKQTYNSYSAGGFWKKFFPINEKVGWYGDLSAGYSYVKSKYPYSVPSSSTSWGYYASLSPGVYYKAGKRIFLNADFGGLNYNHSKSNADDITPGNSASSKSTTFNINFLNYYSFGVSFILNKEHQM